MSAAARELNYSHSAISQQLALLEREVGVALLERVGRAVKLTPAGEDLVRNTEVILAAVERAESDLALAHERPQGVVTVAVFATIARSVMPAVLADLAERLPALDVRLRLCDPDDAVARLVARKVDAVITDAFPGTPGPAGVPGPGGGIHSTLLGADPVRGYLPPGVDGARGDLHGVPWVMEPRETASAQWAMRVCRERGFEPHVVHESSDVLFHLRLVERGLAAAFLPDMVVREAGTALVPSSELPSDQERGIVFLSRAGAEERPALVAVREAVRARLVS